MSHPQGATVHTVWVRDYAVYVNRTLTSLYDENHPCVSYLQPKFTSTECVIDSRKRKQLK